MPLARLPFRCGFIKGMNYIKITKTDIANGAGVRCVLWVSGCDVHCKGCHNPSSWDFDAGQNFDDTAMEELIEALSRPWVQGLTFSGGHPLAYNNLPGVYRVCKAVRERLPEKDIWLYTGYELRANDFDNSVDIGWDNGLLRNHILAMCDVVVDGRYEESLRDISLKFRGSSNQRIIDVKKTIKAKEICLWEGNIS